MWRCNIHRQIHLGDLVRGSLAVELTQVAENRLGDGHFAGPFENIKGAFASLLDLLPHADDGHSLRHVEREVVSGAAGRTGWRGIPDAPRRDSPERGLQELPAGVLKGHAISLAFDHRLAAGYRTAAARIPRVAGGMGLRGED
jgi:hypothetical protein